MLANYLNELLKKSKLCWKCFLEISPFKPGHSSLSRHRCYEGRLILPAHQLDELAAGERRDHRAGEWCGPLPYHIQTR